MRYVIIEDEAPARAQLQADMQDLVVDAKLVASYGTVRESIVGLPTCRDLDLILCDVQLADGSCFEIFDALALQCPVVFCTAYDEYMVQALATQGVDYLLKPIEKKRLALALAKLRSLESHFLQRIEGLGRALAQRPAPGGTPARILAKQGASTVALDHRQISHFVSEDKTVVVVNAQGARYLLDGSLSDLQGQLPAGVFFRANRRFILRAEAVQSFRAAGHGRLAVVVEHVDSPIVVSQENARAFKAWLTGS